MKSFVTLWRRSQRQKRVKPLFSIHLHMRLRVADNAGLTCTKYSAAGLCKMEQSAMTQIRREVPGVSVQPLVMTSLHVLSDS